MSELVVELDGIYVRNDRGGYVFRDLTLKIEPGQSAIIEGSSGSGKTTLAELLIGVRRPERGTMRLFGREIKPGRKRAVREARRKIGGVGGPFDLVPSLSVAENITLPLVISAERKKVQRERLLKMLSEFSLLKLAGRYPASLTRVERTLVQIARAAIGNQPLMIIDEPSAGLDPVTYERVAEFLVRIAVSGRSMILLVSQQPPGKIPNSRHYRLTNGVLE
jgi:putative ABC transport system ATP-binding protein